MTKKANHRLPGDIEECRREEITKDTRKLLAADGYGYVHLPNCGNDFKAVHMC